MRRLGSLAFRSVVTAIVLLLAWSNLKLYFPPTVEADFGKVPRNALPHLNWPPKAFPPRSMSAMPSPANRQSTWLIAQGCQPTPSGQIPLPLDVHAS
jgi:hypothetical protein